MHRFKALEEKINKVPFASGSKKESDVGHIVIPNWTPNNYRRILISASGVVFQHYVTGGVFTKKFSTYDLRAYIEKDLECLAQTPNKYRSVLDALTSGRVLSSVEEIIFCADSYPQELLNFDLAKARIEDRAKLSSRFPRLRHISVTPIDMKTLQGVVGSALEADVLLLDRLKEQNLPITPVVEANNDTWWKSTSLRSSHYSMDKEDGSLARYFNKVKEKFLAEEKQDKLDEVNAERFKAELNRVIPAFTTLYGWMQSLITTGYGIYDKANSYDKVEWAVYLNQQNVEKGLRTQLDRNKERVKEYRAIDFNEILRAMTIYNYPENQIKAVESFRSFVFDDVNIGEEYKRDSNKLGFRGSMTTLQQCLGGVFNAYVNIVYLSFCSHLTRGGAKNAKYFFDKLNLGEGKILYTQVNIAFINRYLAEGDGRTALTLVGSVEVLADTFTADKKYAETLRILNGLSNLVN